MQNKISCHDCGRTLLSGEQYMPYQVAGKEFAKCAVCHEAEPLLRNYQKSEVYSRVVGYIRPVEQWNKGKQAEFKDRLEYADCTA